MNPVDYPLRVTVDRVPGDPAGFLARAAGSPRVGRGLTPGAAVDALLAPLPAPDRPGKGQAPPYLKLLAGDPDE